MKLRNAVRGVAHTMGYRASFAPKLFPWTFGNGAHVHMSIWDMETNKNLMYDAGAEEQFSQMGRYFIGGLLKHMPALVALTCPSYNSYRCSRAPGLPRTWSGASTTARPRCAPPRRSGAARWRPPTLRSRRRTPPPTHTSRSPA